MNFKEIKAKFDELGVSNEDFAYGEYDVDETEVGPSEEVEKYGGEGKGDEWYSVKFFKNHNIYIRIDGYYSSDYGTDFDDDMYEVFPTEVMTTQYLPKK